MNQREIKQSIKDNPNLTATEKIQKLNEVRAPYKEMTDEELIGEILSTKVTENYEKTEKVSFGQKAADAVARFAGSWAFIFSFVAIMIIWMILNVILAANAFDAYPFILLNLVLSCIAAIQAPLIMMSQNRQESIDRRRAENDYKVNLKSEFVIDELYKKTEQIYETQKKILKFIESRSSSVEPITDSSATPSDEKNKT